MNPCQMYDLNFFATHQTAIRESVTALIDYCLRFDNEPGSCAIVLDSLGRFDINYDSNRNNSPYLVLYISECRNILASKSLSSRISQYFGRGLVSDYYKWCKKWGLRPGVSNLKYYFGEHANWQSMISEQFPEIRRLTLQTMYHMFGIACFNSGTWPSQGATMLFQCPECGCFQPLDAALDDPDGDCTFHTLDCTSA